MENALRMREAQQVHAQIMANGRLIGQALVDMAALLKRMRDERLYEEMGRASFEEYLKEDVGLGVRQAYNYISTYERLQPELLEKYSGAGITKLQLLCEVSAPEREEFAEKADLANISVAELEKLVEEKNGLHEQLSLFEAEAKKAGQVQADTAERMRQLEEEITQLRAAPVEVEVREIVKEDPEAAKKIAELEEKLKEQKKLAVELNEQKKAAEKQARAEAEAAEVKAKAAEDRAKKEALAEKEKLVAEAESRARASMEKELAEQKAAAMAEAEDLKKKLTAGAAAASSKEMAEFGVLLKKVQTDLVRMKELKDAMEDEGRRGMMEKALTALREVI